MRFRDAIDRVGQAGDALQPADMDLITEYARVVADHVGVPRSSQATDQIKAALAIMYRAGVVAGRGRR